MGLTSLFQTVTNEMMPGFAFDIGSFHWFLRPHAQQTKIGFALFGSRSFNILASDGADSLSNLQFFASNLGEMVPLSSFVFRRWSHDAHLGDIEADIFVMVSSTSSVFVQVCFKFLFAAEKLSEQVIDAMSKSAGTAGTAMSTKANASELEHGSNGTQNMDMDNAPNVPNAHNESNNA